MAFDTGSHHLPDPLLLFSKSFPRGTRMEGGKLAVSWSGQSAQEGVVPDGSRLHDGCKTVVISAACWVSGEQQRLAWVASWALRKRRKHQPEPSPTLQYFAGNNKEKQVDEVDIKGKDRDVTNKRNLIVITGFSKN